MTNQVVFGVMVVPAIVGLTEVTKDLGVPSRFSPGIAVVFGILAGMAEFYGGQWPWMQAVVLGVSLGLSACGLYSGVKTIFVSPSAGSSLPFVVPPSADQGSQSRGTDG
jgi:hypothetical protein